MPSPFPGMDPYLENPQTWPDLHQRLIAYSAEALQPQLRPKYIARIGERVELSSLRRGYIPDVLLIRSAPAVYGEAVAGGLLVADEPTTIALLEEERRVPFLEIIHHPSGEVVTLIEVLSPANKTGEDRLKYLRKQDDIRNSQVNLVEIDLLGEGPPTTLARLVYSDEPAGWRYMVSSIRVLSPHSILNVRIVGLVHRLDQVGVLRHDRPTSGFLRRGDFAPFLCQRRRQQSEGFHLLKRGQFL